MGEQIASTGKDDTGIFLAKLIVSLLLAPKVSVILVHWGVNIDPTAATLVLATLFHKLHDAIKTKTGWAWL
jgi:hypothetical protein